MYTFVTGGVRSGRSSYALRRASELGPPPWQYVMTSEETDESVKRLIERHRRDKEAIWRTSVMPPDLKQVLDPAHTDGLGAIIIDGLTAWVAHRLGEGASEADLLKEAGVLAETMYRSRVPVVAVATEIALPLLPPDPEACRLLQVAASANQLFASLAGGVVLMVSGVPLRVR